MIRVIAGCLLILLPSSVQSRERLFNGRDLTGWQHWGGGKASVQDGRLILENDDQRRPGYLVSSIKARDFDVSFRCRVIKGDSGFYYRSQPDPRTPQEVIGPQVQLNVEPDRGLGGIFETQGRGWVRKPSPDENARILRSLDWIDCEIRVRGDAIHVSINGQTTAQFNDPAPENRFREAGFFALQIHGGGFCKVVFEDIRVRIHE